MVYENSLIRKTVYLLSYTGTEVVDGLWGKPSSPEGSECEEAWVVPVSTETPNDTWPDDETQFAFIN